jgi:hypothetical protein
MGSRSGNVFAYFRAFSFISTFEFVKKLEKIPFSTTQQDLKLKLNLNLKNC